MIYFFFGTVSITKGRENVLRPTSFAKIRLGLILNSFLSLIVEKLEIYFIETIEECQL